MNRPLVITIGIVVIILVFGVWSFLFMFGAPTDTRDVFSNLGIVDATERPNDVSVDAADNKNVVLSLSGTALQQLTTTPIAGFGIATTSTKTIVRYVERGTGHIYEIDFGSGIQTQISLTTVPRTVDATFSPDLSVVVLTTEEDGRKVVIGEIPKNKETDLQRTFLPSDAQNITLLDNANVHFTRTNTEQTIAYTHEVEEQTETQNFVVNIPDLTVTWNDTKVYGYTKPTQYLEGFLYEINGNTLKPVWNAAYGLIPVFDTNLLTISYTTDDGYQSVLYNQESGVTSKLPILTIPGKCAAEIGSEFIWCGAEVGEIHASYLENWYKGIYSPADGLWRVNPSTQTATLISDPVNETGRSIDVTKMTMGPEGERLLFINKTDSSLWLYTI